MDLPKEHGSANTNKAEISSHGAAPTTEADRSCRNVIRNFTPSWFIITMSTGILSIALHQLPYNGDWLQVMSVIFFVLNLVLFVLFSFITTMRYLLYPELLSVALKHPHQSLFLATFPVGLATLTNMIVLVCAPVWGHGFATLAWTLWWIDSVLALMAFFHFTWVILSHRRAELEEMTALYLIPVVAIVIVASSGALVARAIPNENHQLWTIVISYVYWGMGSCLSWTILTIYFLRLTIHLPVKTEVIVTLLLPFGPLSLSGFSLIVLGKDVKGLFPLSHSLPHVTRPGDILYVIGFGVGLILWGFALVWFVVAVIMITTAGSFPFNMGWWGFIFPAGVFTLLTISIGEELESKFFKVLSCVLAAICVIAWLIVAGYTIRNSINGKMFLAPCLGKNLYQKGDSDVSTEWELPTPDIDRTQTAGQMTSLSRTASV